MAAWMLHGVCFGEVAGARNRVFFLCRGASAGAEKYLVCAAGAAALVSSSNQFSLGVLQRVVVHVCVLLCARCIRGCRSQCNDCVKVAWCRGCACNTIVFCSSHCESYWNGCFQAAIVICQQIFAILPLAIFLLKLILKSASKSCFVGDGVEMSCNFCCHYE